MGNGSLNRDMLLRVRGQELNNKIINIFLLLVCSYFFINNNAIAYHIPIDSIYSHIKVEEKNANGYNRYKSKSPGFKRYAHSKKFSTSFDSGSTSKSSSYSYKTSNKDNKNFKNPLSAFGFNINQNDIEKLRDELNKNPSLLFDLPFHVADSLEPGSGKILKKNLTNPDIDYSNLPSGLKEIRKMMPRMSNID